MNNSDRLEIEILPDGTIKTTSDRVSMPNHANAEAFLRYMATLAGGETTRQRRGDVHHHQETHHHDHDHH